MHDTISLHDLRNAMSVKSRAEITHNLLLEPVECILLLNSNDRKWLVELGNAVLIQSL